MEPTTSGHPLSICSCTYVCINIHVYIYIHTHTCVYTYMYITSPESSCLECVYTYMYIYLYVYRSLQTHTCIHTYTCIYIHTHTSRVLGCNAHISTHLMITSTHIHTHVSLIGDMRKCVLVIMRCHEMCSAHIRIPLQAHICNSYFHSLMLVFKRTITSTHAHI